ncbi:MAG: protein kinase [Chloroflexi bacterium]|nr:protein kinase [Chloroflexota bacterium]
MRNFRGYTNLVEVGRGGMATTYRATSSAGNIVAVKIIAQRHAQNSVSRRRFENEIALGVSLNHPNIVRVIDYGMQDDTPFIVMDYIAGDSLERRLRAQPLSPQEFLPILLDVAKALDYAHFIHQPRVIHRDVKPANILLRSDGRAMLADFGIAKLDGMTAFTATDVRIGSVYYMSPEQAAGQLELTPASDIYSLGITAFHVLTGRQPFTGDHEIAIARMQMDDPPPHLCEINPAIPQAICSVVLSAIAKSPSKRPASAGKFADLFQRAIEQSNQEFKGDRYHSLAPIKPIELPIEAASSTAARPQPVVNSAAAAAAIPPVKPIASGAKLEPVAAPLPEPVPPIAAKEAAAVVTKPAAVSAPAKIEPSMVSIPITPPKNAAPRKSLWVWWLWVVAALMTGCAVLGLSTNWFNVILGRIGLFNVVSLLGGVRPTPVPTEVMISNTVTSPPTYTPLVLNTPIVLPTIVIVTPTRNVLPATVVVEPTDTPTPRVILTPRQPIVRLPTRAPTRVPTRTPAPTAKPLPSATPPPPPVTTPTRSAPTDTPVAITVTRPPTQPPPTSPPALTVTRPPIASTPAPIVPSPHPVPLPTRTPTRTPAP